MLCLLGTVPDLPGPCSAQPAPVAGPRRLPPVPPGPFGQAIRLLAVPLVHQPVAERVLAGQVGAHAEISFQLAGDDGILMLAEDGLQPLHLPGEPARVLAERRRDSLARVAGALRGLA